jgi:DNA-nicking Smr family endonuclease
MKRKVPQLDAPVSRKRVLSVQEAELWRSVMEDTTNPKPKKETASAVAAEKPKTTQGVKKTKPPPQPHRLDSASRAKIHKGKAVIDATLDLHGFTVDVAHRMLVRFVARMQSDVTRIVLVITGKGRAPQSGILRAQLPHWLEILPLCEQVSGFSPAGIAHGGEGAWYIKIRKRSAGKT